MSSPDSTTPWGAPQSPSGPTGGAQPPFGGPPTVPSGDPAPPPMMSPYGMPLSGGGPEGSGSYDGYGGPGGHGPGSGGPGDGSRRRKTLIASALAVVAVVGIGGAVAFMSGGSPKPDKAALAGAGASESGGAPAGNGAGVRAWGGGKPDGDAMVGASTNGAQGVNVPDSPTGANGATTGGAPGQNPGSTSAPGGNPGPSNRPGAPATSAPGAPASSNPAPSAPKPSTPVSTTKAAAAPPSSDCTYLDLPAPQMPTIKEGSGNVNAVKEVQCLLKKSELGIKPLVIDGQWGSDTQSAMIAFQNCNNSPTVKTPGGTPPYPKLAVDGVAGPQTWADLYFWDNQYFNGTSYYCNGTR